VVTDVSPATVALPKFCLLWVRGHRQCQVRRVQMPTGTHQHLLDLGNDCSRLTIALLMMDPAGKKKRFFRGSR